MYSFLILLALLTAEEGLFIIVGRTYYDWLILSFGRISFSESESTSSSFLNAGVLRLELFLINLWRTIKAYLVRSLVSMSSWLVRILSKKYFSRLLKTLSNSCWIELTSTSDPLLLQRKLQEEIIYDRLLIVSWFSWLYREGDILDDFWELLGERELFLFNFLDWSDDCPNNYDYCYDC